MLRILHIADAHLDTPFYGREESLRQRLRLATREAFQAAVDYAINREVHAFLIAGDLFDNDRLSFATEEFLLDQMVRLRDASIPVFYATGNHDPGRANYRAHQLKWPDNVRLFRSGNPETVPIGEAGWLTAAGHSTKEESKNLASEFGTARDNQPHVAMLHTQVMSAREADRHDRYAPCSHGDLAAPRFDYWALGHVHLRQQVYDDLPAWYAGNLQGRHPRETGPKGALYVEVEKGSVPEPEFLPLAPVVWEQVELECPRDAATFDAFTRALADTAGNILELDEGHEYFVRINLTGETALARELADEENVQELANTLADALGVEWLEVRPHNVVRPVNLDDYRGSPTVLGQALELIEEAKNDEELLGHLVPEELAGEPDKKMIYLRELLRGIEHEAATRLVPEEER